LSKPGRWLDLLVAKCFTLVWNTSKVIDNCCILLNGQTLQYTLNYKELANHPSICNGTTPVDIQYWYIEMELHANNCGYYIIPPYNFRIKPMNLMVFFLFKISPRFFILTNLLGLITLDGFFVVLVYFQHKPLFLLLASCVHSTTNRYHVLHAIINQSHPLFVDKPALMSPDLPYQAKGQSLVEFYKQYMDNIVVNTIFLGTLQDL
jgi:hypothetical protein